MKKQIAFFDFDGTITRKDTLLQFIKFNKGNLLFFVGFALNIPYLIAYKLRIISNQNAKERVLQFFFRGTSVKEFQHQCEIFAMKIVPTLIRAAALEEIQRLKSRGIHVVVVSASPENWIRPWTNSLEVDLLATRLEAKEGRLTGKIMHFNCHGEEKVRRIQERFVLSEYDKVLAYGDTAGDKPMLQLAHSSFYKPFR